MAMQTFFINGKKDHVPVHYALSNLPDGIKHKVTLEEYVPDRSLDANSEYWVSIVTPAAEQLGYESSDELHFFICCELYGTKVKKFGDKEYLYPVKSTTKPKKMTKREFLDHRERASALVVNMGVTLPMRDHEETKVTQDAR